MPAVVAAAEAASALATAGEVIGTAGALEVGATIGANLATGAELASLGVNAAELGTQAGGIGAQLTATPGIAEIAPAAVQQASQGIPGGLEALKQQAISQGVQNAATNQATNLAMQNAIGQNVAGGIANTGASTLANAAGNNATYNQILEYFSRPGLGQNLGNFSQYEQLASNGPTQLVEKAVPQSWEAANKASGIGAQPTIAKDANFITNAKNFINNPSWQAAKDYAVAHPFVTSTGVSLATKALLSQPDGVSAPPQPPAMMRPYSLDVQNTSGQPMPAGSAERNQLTYNFTPLAPYRAGTEPVKKAVGGPVEAMSAQNAIGSNMGYPQSQLQTTMYSNPMVQRPMPANMINAGVDAGVDPYSGELKMAAGGIADLGSYSDGGRLLKGPGDGVSDSIPAVIGKHQPARLADGEFVVPARIVSELGNGSTEAGARKLYAMMDRVQKARGKTTGKGKVAVNSKADKHLPA